MARTQETATADLRRTAAPAVLRCDFHVHSSDDPYDRIGHDLFALVDHAAALGIHCLAITNHLAVTRREDAADHARSRNILLLPGVELTIKGRHVLFINPPEDLDPLKIRNFPDLRPFRREESLVIPAHPFYPGATHFGDVLEAHAGLWDGIELCHLYTRRLDFNQRSRDLARSLGLPLVATSDAHSLRHVGIASTEVEAEPDPLAIARAVRAGKAAVRTRPLGVVEAAKVAWKTMRTAGSPPSPPGHRRSD